MIVTFCGHKDIINTEELSAKLRSVLCELIAAGADHFLLGGYGAFDSMAAIAVKKIKADYPGIRSTLVLAYLNREYDKALYDDTIYPPLEGIPPKYAIPRRNEWMVESADVVVAWVTHDWGGAAATLRYAKRKHKRIINLAE